VVIFNRNSQVCFYNPTETERLTNINRARHRAQPLS
jgi:hypothetical protein